MLTGNTGQIEVQSKGLGRRSAPDNTKKDNTKLYACMIRRIERLKREYSVPRPLVADVLPRYRPYV